MRSLVLVGLAGAAACGESKVVLELTGDVRADRVEVLLLEPVVLARPQLHHRPESNLTGSLETVFYMAERSRTTIELGGASADGLQFEIRDAGGAYVPLVGLRTGDRLLALGLHDPESIFAAPVGGAHTPRAVAPVGDVTIYPIPLELVDRVFPLATAEPQPVQPREVMTVPCKPDGPVSGFAWRRADGHQLRVLVPMGGDRLSSPDLDCDQHAAGKARVEREDVPQGDCDDTAFAIHAGARERCSKLDEDCNSDTTVATRPCTGSCLSPVCLCGDGGPTEEICPLPVTEACKLPSTSVPLGGLQPCESAGAITLAPCQTGCEVLIESVPEGMEVAISDAPDQPGSGPGAWVKLTDARAFLSVRASRPFAAASQILAVRFRAPNGAASPPAAIPLQLFDAQECAPTPSLLDCPP